jgi:hypothetical protein
MFFVFLFERIENLYKTIYLGYIYLYIFTFVSAMKRVFICFFNILEYYGEAISNDINLVAFWTF